MEHMVKFAGWSENTLYFVGQSLKDTGKTGFDALKVIRLVALLYANANHATEIVILRLLLCMQSGAAHWPWAA